jgi:hypothetical protein
MLFTTWGTQRGNLVCILPVWLGNINFFRVINNQSKRRKKSGRVINNYVSSVTNMFGSVFKGTPLRIFDMMGQKIFFPDKYTIR